jgi:hypothetical protein
MELNEMAKKDNAITCPNCGHKIDVNELLYHQLEEELQKKFQDNLAKVKKDFKEKESLIEKERKILKREKDKLSETINKKTDEAIKTEIQKIEKQLKKELDEEKSEQIKSMQDELEEKSKELRDYNKAKSDIERLKREKEELKSSIEAESEKKLTVILKEEREKIQKEESEKINMKLFEKDHLVEQLKKQLQEAQRKAEQGSMQLQGEVQEIAIEEWLRDRFPLDTIEEVKKGARGADCIQIINTRSKQNCGSIYYESKRTKVFQISWIEKFKDDIRDRGANIGVLVTENMPDDMDRMGLRDGVWICTFEEFKGLCTVLRESLIQLNNAICTQENKGDKINMLYDFLTSNEFRLQIEGIVEGFTQMKSDLESEKRSMQGIWKKREKQIEKVLLNTTFMYSSIKGIAGSAIQPVRKLELPAVDDNVIED